MQEKSKIERVMVHLRIRPFNEDDMNRYGRETAIELTDNSKGIIVMRKDYDKKSFNFDSVFDSTVSQAEVFHRVAEPVVNSVIEGYNGTIFSYGQTGTGKTFTMIGGQGEQQGVIPRSAHQIFSHIQSSSSHAFTVKVGFLQIYMEMLQDLLSPNVDSPIRIREDPDEGVYLSGMTWVPVNSMKECMELMYQGDKNRNTAFTSMNSHSSRSHAVYMIKMEKRVKYTGEQLEEIEKRGEKPDQSMTKSTLYLVDLAGSERVSKSKASGSRLDEAKNINLALLALGNCIQALADKSAKYIPFRDSKLTRLLEESLGGNSKTSLVVTIGPSLAHFQESLSSLLFGSRAMKVENRPELNIKLDYKALCAQLQAELDRINDNNSMWSIEKQQLIEKINKLNLELETANTDKAEMQLIIDEMARKTKDVNLTAYEESKQLEMLNLKTYYKEKMKKKESEFKRQIEEYDKTNSDQEGSIAHYKVQILDYEGKNFALKQELKRTNEELEHERSDRQIRINQMSSEIDELQRALALEKIKNEKENVLGSFEVKNESSSKYEEIIKNNEENFRRTTEEYEQDINILRDNLFKLSLERDELLVEKTRLLGKLGTLTKKASHIAKESVRIRSETENNSQEVKTLKELSQSLVLKNKELATKLAETQDEKDSLLNNVKVLSRIHQEFAENEKSKTAQLKFLTEEVYMIMKDMERKTIRFQEKMLYFITQKAQHLGGIKKEVLKVFYILKNNNKNLQEQAKVLSSQKELSQVNAKMIRNEANLLKARLKDYEKLKI
jgi:kinesin family member 5